MNFNKKAISQLLTLDDESLVGVIKGIAIEAGVDPSKISLKSSDVANIRAALSVASNEDIAKFAEQFGKNNK